MTVPYFLSIAYLACWLTVAHSHLKISFHCSRFQPHFLPSVSGMAVPQPWNYASRKSCTSAISRLLASRPFGPIYYKILGICPTTLEVFLFKDRASRSHCTSNALLLLLSPKRWDHRHATSCLVYVVLGVKARTSQTLFWAQWSDSFHLCHQQATLRSCLAECHSFPSRSRHWSHLSSQPPPPPVLT